MSDIKAGDYVKLVTDGGYRGCGFEVGDIHKVVSTYSTLVHINRPGTSDTLSFYVPEEAVKYEELPLEVGATVRFKENGLDVKVGSLGTVADVPDYDSSFAARIKHEGGTPEGTLYYAHEFEVIESIKQEETVSNTKFKAGDIVEAVETASGVTKGKQYTVQSVDAGDGKPLLWLSSSTAAFARRFKLVEAKAKPVKAKSQKINPEDVQKGDLIVAFNEFGGVEHRTKGVADHKNWAGEWFAEDSGCLTRPNDLAAENIFLLERPELVIEDGVYHFTKKDGKGNWFWAIEGNKYAERRTLQDVLGATKGNDGSGWVKEVFGGGTAYTVPVKLEAVDLLDKTKTYVAHSKAGRDVSSYYLKHIEGNWHYSSRAEVTPANSKLEQWSANYLVEGSSSWQKPVEYIEKPKPVFESGTYYVTEKNFPKSLWEVIVDDEKADWKPLHRDGQVAGYLNHSDLVHYKTSNIVTIHKDMTTLDKRQKALALGLLGNTYESTSGIDYRVTNKGNVKARFADRSQHSDGWDNTGATLDHVNRNVKSGNYTKKN